MTDMDEQTKQETTDPTLQLKGHKEFTKEFMVSGQLVIIDAFFSVGRAINYEQFIQHYSARDAFVKLVYSMYTNTAPTTENSLKESDFTNASDEELTAILYFVGAQDEKAEAALVTVAGDSIYDKFKAAFDASWQPMRDSIAKTFSRMNAPTEAFSKMLRETARLPFPKLKSFSSHTYNLASLLPKFDYPRIGSVLANSLKHNLPGKNDYLLGASSALRSLASMIPKYDTPKISSVLSDTLAQFATYVKQFTPAYDDFKNNISTLVGQFQTIDFSLITLQERWSKQHDTFVAFGWFYLAELPQSFINAIYKERKTITADEVNVRICAFFREKQCTSLKAMLKRWNESPYFAPRRHVLHEALVNHSTKHFNSSVMMLTLQTEGVISDFVRIRLKIPRWETKKAIEDIANHLDSFSLDEIGLTEARVYDTVLTQLTDIMTEQFLKADPDKTSNRSRHKIGHGHVVEKETETNSLKCFLYLNELWRLLTILDQATDEEAS